MSDDEFREGRSRNNVSDGGSDQLLRHARVTTNLDTIFDLLSVARVRYVLYYLYEMDGEVAQIEDVIDVVCEYEAAGTKTEEPPSRSEIRIDVHHSKLPRLEEADIVDYDPRQNEIRFYHSSSLEEWLEHARHKEIG